MDTVNYKCPNCSAGLAFDSKSQKMKCEYCGNTYSLEELEQLANGEEVFEKMVVTMKKLSEDEKIRMQCEAREDYERCLLSEFNAGKREGEEIGEKRGEKRGRIAGKAEALTELINNLMETQHISEEEAKKMLKL